jgi:TolB protein
MIRRLQRIGLLAVLPALMLTHVEAGAQAPNEVRIGTSLGQGRRIPIHCESLETQGRKSPTVSSVEADEVIANDLDQSAVFAVSKAWAGGEPPTDVQGFVGGKWKVQGNQLTLTGEVKDFPARRPILVREYKGPVTDWRRLVHRFADDVVQTFTGELGIASTRVAYAVRDGRNKELWVMDVDGARKTQLTNDKSIALSPGWSPDGSLILFTTYRAGHGPQINVVPATGGRSFVVSGRNGLNTSASYSPDGREIVCTLSFEGNPEIYVLDARGGSPRRLTNARGIDTSPVWSPTGREIAFTSDRGGSPQVYVMDRDGGNVRRLSYEVSYTDSPAWSPKGDRIAFVSRTGSGFDIYVAQADGTSARRVVAGSSNENPRWSPDGRHLLFASNREGAYGLFITDLDDRAPRRLDTGGREAMSPAWSPRPFEAGNALSGPGDRSAP